MEKERLGFGLKMKGFAGKGLERDGFKGFPCFNLTKETFIFTCNGFVDYKRT